MTQSDQIRQKNGTRIKWMMNNENLKFTIIMLVKITMLNIFLTSIF